MERKFFSNKGRKLSYIDFGGKGDTIITLHGHFGCATMYAKLQKELPRNFRVVSLDQQGHGYSDWGNTYSREEYVDDIRALYEELNIKEAIIIAHSLGGVNAYQFAAKHPDKVKALVIEDIGTNINDDLSFILGWPTSFKSLRLCYEFLTEKNINNYLYFMESLVRTEEGLSFQFDSKGLVKSQINLNGNWTDDWDKIKCNTLLMHGENSKVLDGEQAKCITKGRDNMALIDFDNCSHTIRDDNFEEYKNTIIDFLISCDIIKHDFELEKCVSL